MNMNIETVIGILVTPHSNFHVREVSELKQTLLNEKKALLAAGDESGANTIWCFQQILTAQTAFVAAVAHCKLEEFYAGWCDFEVAEIALRNLQPYFSSYWREFWLSFIESHVAKFQKMFPYRVFSSIGLAVKEQRCSICGALRGLRTSCMHKNGELYGGQMCVSEIGESSILEISMVENPVHKFAVPFIIDANGNEVDHYDYSLIGFVIDRL